MEAMEAQEDMEDPEATEALEAMEAMEAQEDMEDPEATEDITATAMMAPYRRQSALSRHLYECLTHVSLRPYLATFVTTFAVASRRLTWNLMA
jgi:hypothetical protein